MKHRRSLLWTSALDLDKLAAGIASSVDSIVLDLEDTVPEKQKAWARTKTAELLQTWDFQGRERVVRINHLTDHCGREDLSAVLPARPDTIRLPKCETVDYVLEADRIIGDFERQQGLPSHTIELILMIESPLGVLCAYELASCTERVTAIGIGIEDLTTHLDIERNYEIGASELLYAKQKVVMAGRAAGVQVIDSCVLFRDNTELLYEDSLRSKAMGFSGRSVMEVAHVDATNRAFSPSERQIGWARRVIDHYQKLEADASLSPYLDGTLIDVPVVAKAQQILARSDVVESC